MMQWKKGQSNVVYFIKVDESLNSVLKDCKVKRMKLEGSSIRADIYGRNVSFYKLDDILQYTIKDCKVEKIEYSREHGCIEMHLKCPEL